MENEVFPKKHLLSLRLLPSIFLGLLSLGYSFAYLDNKYANRFEYLQAGGFFGIAVLLLFLDIALECFYKKDDLIYHLLSTCIAGAELFYFGFAILTHFKQLPSGADPRFRIFPTVLLSLLLLMNLLYRVLAWTHVWKTEKGNENDLLAAYIGYLGLGAALLNSFPFSIILMQGDNVSLSYIGIFADIALAFGILEALVGLLWFSFEKIRASHKSNIFFYLTVINFFASLAGLVVSAFGYSYALINIRTANFCFAFYSLSIVLIGSGLLYLNYLLKKGR